MPDGLRGWLLRLLRVPAEPAPPPGDPRVVRTFRASTGYFRYRVAAWLLKQLSALAGLILGYLFFRGIVGALPFPYIRLIEQLAIAGFIAQLPLSFALLRLDFELRWYIISDRSLRIRDGILSVREQTMAFANIQNITIRQNPLQRLFGIATVVVQAAGGGGATSSQQGAGGGGRNSHEATFEGVDNAEQIRAAIRERIRMHRDAGLGDPDDRAVPATAPEPGRARDTSSLRPAVAAAWRVRAEAAALRAALGARATP
jgi:membrane protein YdbS with pleckstrin-like domain